ncbi:MAG: murein biosynthesis integral membrane protein MurJ [Candidatus Sungbacteria bacterium]|nr:murein biosynthesis integral membrane protein MurJ [Candidatus Sungbacteria bacterium]
MRIGILNAEINGVHSAALILGAAGLCSRGLGVLRDRLLASQFGAGRELDMYYAAFQIPDFLNVLFLLGAASAAILPVFQEELAKSDEDARKFISDLVSVFALVAGAAAVASFFIMPILISFFTPGFSAAERTTTALLSRIMLFSPLFLGISAILSAVTQSFQRFFAYALAPIFYNLGIIAGIIFFVPAFGIMGLAWGVVFGVFLHFAVQFLSAADLGFLPNFQFSGISRAMRRVAKLSIPRVFSVSLSNLTILVIIGMGSLLTEGSIAVFQLAFNLQFLPIGIFGISYATAIFPRMSRAYIERRGEDFFNEFGLGLRTILFWLAPSAVLFIVLRAHIVRVALGAGVFSWEDTRLSAAALAIFAIAMVPGGLAAFFIKSFYALENTWAPLVINLAASAVSIVLAYGASHVLAGSSAIADFVRTVLRISDLPHIEVLGLVFGFSAGILLNIAVLGRVLTGLARQKFGIKKVLPLRPFLQIAVAVLLAGFLAYAVRASFSASLPLISFFQVLVQGAVSGAAGFAAYFGILWLMGNEDVRAVMGAFRRKFFRLAVLPQNLNGDHS